MKNIIITGGGMINKGAEAMTLIAVNELKNRFPNHNIILYSEMDRQRPQKELDNYKFDIMGWHHIKFAKCQSNPILRFLNLIRNKSEVLEVEKIYKNTDLLIDISGYALGSNWSEKICMDFLEPLYFAKQFNVPYYLMPQSFGPFDFDGQEGERVEKMISRVLPYAKKICVREQEAMDILVKKYNLNNIVLLPDIVLNNKSVDLNNIYRKIPKLELPHINSNSIGIIPNQRNFDVGDEKEICELYRLIIENTLRFGNTVYILRHSTMDVQICKTLKNMFVDNEKVILLEDEYSCVEFNELVKKFKYLVASRYHSIVHAYKNNIPCIAIGWAKKYFELAEKFNQSKFFFDIRKKIEVEQLLVSLADMEENYKKESREISLYLDEIQKNSVFDIINERF